MKNGIIILVFIVLLGVIAQRFLQEKILMREEIQAEKYIIYKNASGGISKYPLPASTGTGDGNIYLTGATDRIIYGIGKNVSGEIEYFEDPLDIVTNFSEVIPSADWVLNPNGHKMTLKMYGIFQALEKGEEGLNTMKQVTDGDTFEVYSLFRSPSDSSLKECLSKPYEVDNIDTITNATAKAMCKEKVPNDLTFGIHDTDQRYKRLRMSLFYKAYTEKNVSVCEPLLVTKFPKDKENDISASHFINYQLCQSIAVGDPYTKTQVPISEAIRRMSYRINAAVLYDKCSLYTDGRLQTLCEELRMIHLTSVKGNG